MDSVGETGLDMDIRPLCRPSLQSIQPTSLRWFARGCRVMYLLSGTPQIMSSPLQTLLSIRSDWRTETISMHLHIL